MLYVEDDCSDAIAGDCGALTAEVKLSKGLASGGDIKLEIGGRRVIVVDREGSEGG